MMRRILGTIGVVAVAAVAGFAIAGPGGDTQTHQGTVAATQLQGASVEPEVSDDGATLVAENVPEPRPGEMYMVWLKRPEVDSPEPTSTLFLPRGDGSATAAVRGDLDGVESVLVTREPASGSDTPSEDPVMTIPLSNAQVSYVLSDGGGKQIPLGDGVDQAQPASADEQRNQFVVFPRKSQLELLMRSARL